MLRRHLPSFLLALCLSLDVASAATRQEEALERDRTLSLWLEAAGGLILRPACAPDGETLIVIGSWGENLCGNPLDTAASPTPDP